MRPSLMMAVLLGGPLFGGCTEYGVLTDIREETVNQHFVVDGVRVDVLFYGDTSYSMERELREVGQNIDRFTSRLEQNAEDWQIIAVTGPDGCGQGGVITPAMPDWQDVFAEGIRTPPGQDDVDEWGLFNAFKAVLGSAPGGCNEGFVRPDASLHVIFLSDEADHSPGWELGGDYWRDYVDPIIYMKDERAQVRFSAVVGPVPSGCTGAEPGYGYTDAVDYGDGELLSICEDWLQEVDLLADASIFQDFFPLDWEPLDPTLILVQVNGDERVEGWVYEAEEQGIRFTEDPPGAWDEVHVRYRALVEVEVEG